MIRAYSPTLTRRLRIPIDSLRLAEEKEDSSSTTSIELLSGCFALGALAGESAKRMLPNLSSEWRLSSDMTLSQRKTFKRGWMCTALPLLLLEAPGKTLSLLPSNLSMEEILVPQGSVNITLTFVNGTTGYIELNADGRCELLAISFSSLLGDCACTG